MEVESIVTESGAVPATIAILDGVPHVGKLYHLPISTRLNMPLPLEFNHWRGDPWADVRHQTHIARLRLETCWFFFSWALLFTFFLLNVPSLLAVLTKWILSMWWATDPSPIQISSSTACYKLSIIFCLSFNILRTIIGLTSEQLKRLAISGRQFQKTARRDIAHVVSTLHTRNSSFLGQADFSGVVSYHYASELWHARSGITSCLAL